MDEELVTYKMRGLNYSGSFGEEGKRCPYCGQRHLRSGYCQALDRLNAARYAGIWDGSVEVDPGHILAGSDYARWHEVRFAHRENTLGSGRGVSVPNADFASDFSELAKDLLADDETLSSETGVTSAPPNLEKLDLAFQKVAEEENSVPFVTLRCEECGVNFVGQRSTAKYCSATCRKRAMRKRDAEAAAEDVGSPDELVCAHCGEKFVPKYLHMKYCSRDCRDAAGRARLAARKK